VRFSGLITGFHTDAHRRAFEAGRDAFLAAGGPRRCASRTKSGRPCGGWALRGQTYCTHHAPVSVRRARRLRLLSHPKTAAQAARALLREGARVQRVTWTRDRWVEGATIVLGLRDKAFMADARSLGFMLDQLSPASRDAARWAWLNLKAGRMTTDQFRDRLRWHAARDSP
jgi:hypothetical protein